MRHGLMRAFFAAVVTALAATAAYADQNLPLAPPSAPAVASLASGTSGCKNCNSGGPVVVQGVGSCAPNTGCSSCGPTVKKSCFNNYLYGTATPISGGCFAATNTAIFGSTKSFFNPCNSCADNGGCGKGGRTSCSTPIYGPATPGSLNNCTPFSYTNR